MSASRPFAAYRTYQQPTVLLLELWARIPPKLARETGQSLSGAFNLESFPLFFVGPRPTSGASHDSEDFGRQYLVGLVALFRLMVRLLPPTECRGHSCLTVGAFPARILNQLSLINGGERLTSMSIAAVLVDLALAVASAILE